MPSATELALRMAHYPITSDGDSCHFPWVVTAGVAQATELYADCRWIVNGLCQFYGSGMNGVGLEFCNAVNNKVHNQ